MDGNKETTVDKVIETLQEIFGTQNEEIYAKAREAAVIDSLIEKMIAEQAAG